MKMKNTLLLAAGAVMALSASAQQRGIMKIERLDGTTEQHYVDEIARITFLNEGDAPAPEAQAVDLGLSVKWATCNLDATAPEKSGGFYAWGETQTKEVYNDETYQFFNLEWGTIQRIGSEITGTQHDAATVRLGGEWRMPTHDEWAELRNNCQWEWTALNGVSGYRVTAANGNSIFLPAAGRLYSVEGQELNGYENIGGFYWTSTLAEDNDYNYRAYRFQFGQSSYGEYESYDAPSLGYSIRPVQGALADVDPEPEPGPMDMVDLGLSVKWASHNVMASKASEPGNFYAWGMTKVQGVYGDPAYKYCDMTTNPYTYTDLGDDISGTKYDVATVRWGQGWHLPTKEQVEELLANTTQTWTTEDGKYGYRCTAANGNSIFLPVAGYMGAEGLMCADMYDVMGMPFTSHYMTANPKPLRSGIKAEEHSAYTLRLTKWQNSDPSIKQDDTFKSIGILVRPVHD